MGGGARSGGRILVDQLVVQGVERVFMVPGESFLPVLDALIDSPIQPVVGRQEGGVAMMADAVGKLTGRPGVAFVTRGPGLANATAGIHVARQDSTPMVVFVGQVEREQEGREAFQEVDIAAAWGPLAKWAAEIRDPRRIPEMVARAFHIAVSGRPGPVVLGLPEDMLSEQAEVPDRPRVEPVRQCFDAPAAEAVGALLADAERPLVIVGGPRWSERAARDLAAFAGAWDLPVAVPFRRQDRLDNRHPSYIGDLNFAPNPALARRVAEADVVLALGTRLGDIVTGGYTRIDPLTEPATSGRRLIHIHADPDEPGKVFHADLAFAAPADVAVAALARLAPPAGSRRWARWRAEARADYERWLEPVRLPGELQLGEVIRWLSENLPEDAIVTNGAGNYAGFLHRHFQFRRHGQQLAPTSGSMGYGLPAAIAAALTRPGRQVVCLAGDGCMQMTMNEMSTARQYGARLVALVVNNGIYGTIRMHQERRFPGRVIGSDLANPDWPALARAQGWHGARVTRTADFPAAFAEAAACDGPALIELVLDPEALTPGRTLSQIRAEALAARSDGRSG